MTVSGQEASLRALQDLTRMHGGVTSASFSQDGESETKKKAGTGKKQAAKTKTAEEKARDKRSKALLQERNDFLSKCMKEKLRQSK